MKYLLDTDVVIDHLRKKKILKTEMLNAGAVISIITLAELIYGVYKSDSPSESFLKLEKALKLLNLKVENINELIVSKFAKIKADLEKSGQRLEDFDLLIAATALVNNLTLVTKNLSHFKRIKNLKLG